MIRTIFTATLAGSALALAAPALAAPGGIGGGAGMGAGANINAGGMAGPSAHANVNAGLNAHTTTATPPTTNPAVGVSQGPAHASVNGIAHANSHSVLAAGAVPSTSLPGLSTGLTVNTSGGTTLGTVSQIVTGPDGSIRMVIVTSSTGQTYRLPASSLSISGGVVTTTQTP